MRSVKYGSIVKTNIYAYMIHIVNNVQLTEVTMGNYR